MRRTFALKPFEDFVWFKGRVWLYEGSTDRLGRVLLGHPFDSSKATSAYLSEIQKVSYQTKLATLKAIIYMHEVATHPKYRGRVHNPRKSAKRLPKHPEQREFSDITEKSGFDIVVIARDKEMGFMPVSKAGKNLVKNFVHAPKKQWRGRAFWWPGEKAKGLFSMMYFSLPVTIGIIDETSDKRWTED